MQYEQHDVTDEMLTQPGFWDNVRMSDPFVEVRATLEQTRGDKMALHSHVFYEIIFVTSGCVQYMLDTSRYRLEIGDVLLIPPGISHSPIRQEPDHGPYTRIVIWLNPDFWGNCVQKFPELDDCFKYCRERKSYLMRTSRAVWQNLYPHFQALVHESEQRNVCWELCLRSNVIQLMANISRIYHYRTEVMDRSCVEGITLVDEIFHYIDANLSRRITLSETADHFFVSTSTISHMFQKQLGVSFYRCVVQRKLIHAKNQILSGTSLWDTAEKCGFSDYSSFFRLFKKEYGISPKTFKAENSKP